MNRSTMFSWPSLFCLAVLLHAAPGEARGWVDMAVIDRDTGHTLPRVRHHREQWIAGTPGHRYRVRLTNRSDERVLVVLSVDGVNAVTGETADPAQTGYVLGPWQTTDVDGWRKSHEQVAGFVFTDLGDSYAARTARPQHVGVIGIAEFEEAREEYRPRRAPPIAAKDHNRQGSRNASAESASSADMARASHAPPAANPQSIGTGHGRREWSPVSTIGFVRASRSPSAITEVRYDDHAALVARGILPAVLPHEPYRPSAFPSGFVADPPPRWRR